MKPRWVQISMVILVLAGLGTTSPSAEIYKWVDEEGVPYFTDNMRKIPELYREQSEEVIPPPLVKISPIVPFFRHPP